MKKKRKVAKLCLLHCSWHKKTRGNISPLSLMLTKATSIAATVFSMSTFASLDWNEMEEGRKKIN